MTIIQLVVALVFAIAGGEQSASPLEVTEKSRAVQPGEVVVLTVKAPADLDRVRVRAFGQEVAVFPASASGRTTWEALVGIDLDVKPGTHAVAIDAEPGGL